MAVKKLDVEVRLAGETYWLKPTWEACRIIAERVQDPVQMIFRLETTRTLPTFAQMVRIVHIALSCSYPDLEMTENEVGQAMFEAGYSNYHTVVGEYLGLLTTGGVAPEEPAEGSRQQRRAAARRSAKKGEESASGREA